MSSDETYETVKSDLDAKIAECSAAISRNPRDSSAYRQRGLPRAAAQMKEEAAQLVGLRNEQLAEELLPPLLQACEAANKSHRAIESEVLRAGFGPGSTGSVKALFDKFATAVGSTAKLPFSDAPWRLVRDVAISLNNDSSAPRAAENLIQVIFGLCRPHSADSGNDRNAATGPEDRPQKSSGGRPWQESSGSKMGRG